MIIEFDCKLCKEHFKVNGQYKAADAQREHMRTKHIEEWKVILSIQKQVSEAVAKLREKLTALEIFGEEDSLNDYVIY